MKRYLVTTATTVYERYEVFAETAVEARRMVSEGPRSDLRSAPYGDNGDETVIDAQEAPE